MKYFIKLLSLFSFSFTLSARNFPEKIIPVIIFSIVLFSSCSEEISSKNIPTNQVLRHYSAYRPDTGTTYVTAEFFAEAGLTIPPFRDPFGKRITLFAPSKVTFNGQEMEYNKDFFGDVTYRISLDRWPSNFRWDWIDKNGKKYSDSAKMDTIKIGRNYLVPAGNNTAIAWTGSPIRRDEEITVSIEGGDRDYFESFNRVGSKRAIITGSGSIIEPILGFDVEISRTLKLRRVKEISTENVAGSFITLKYYFSK